MTHSVSRFSILSFFLLTASFAAQERGFQPVSDDELLRILARAKLDAQIVEPAKIRFNNAGISITIKNNGKDALLFAGFDTKGQGQIDRVIKWNRLRSTDTRAYLDAENDPCLEADIDFEQRIDPAAIRDRVLAFAAAALRFQDQVAGSAAIEPVAQPPDFNLPPGLVAGVLEDLKLDYSYERITQDLPGKPIALYQFKIEDEKLDLSVDAAGRLCLEDHHGEQIKPEAVNLWNRQNRFARAVLDENNTPSLAADLILPPEAMRPPAVRQWIRVFVGSRRLFHKMIEEAASGLAQTEHANLPDGWSLHTFEPGFQLALPGQPETFKEMTDSPAGPVGNFGVRVKLANLGVGAFQQNNPPAAKDLSDREFFEAMTEGMLPEGARITRSDEIEADSLPGRDFTFEGPGSDGKPRSGRARILRDGTIGYALLIHAPAGQLDESLVANFFKSFARITKKPDNAPPPAPPARPDQPPTDPPGPSPNPASNLNTRPTPPAPLPPQNRVPFQSEPEHPGVPDIALWKREVPQGWIDRGFPLTGWKAAFPAEPSEREQIRPTTLGPAENWKVVSHDERATYTIESWSFPEAADHLDDEAFFALLLQNAFFPGRHTLTQPAARIKYGPNPARCAVYRSITSSSGTENQVIVYVIRRGRHGYLMAIAQLPENVDSGLAAAFFHSIVFPLKPITSSRS